MKAIHTYVTSLRKRYPFILTFGVLGAVLGIVAAMLRPGAETSNALTTLTSSNLDLQIDQIYSVNQMIRVTMPNYIAYGQDSSVVDAAASATGIDPGKIDAGLVLTRQPDANVIEWKLTTPKGTDAQRALGAALKQFEAVVAQSAPKTAAGKAVVSVVVNRPPGQTSLKATSPVTAGIAGALVGLLAAIAVIIARQRQSDTVTSRDNIEIDLRMPVVGELSDDDESRTQAWRYAAATLARRREPHRLLVLGGRLAPFSDDVERLEKSVAELLPGFATAVVVRTLDDTDIPRLAGGADGVVVVLARGVDSTGEVGGRIRSLRHLCSGPVVVLLDDSERAKNAAWGSS